MRKSTRYAIFLAFFGISLMLLLFIHAVFSAGYHEEALKVKSRPVRERRLTDLCLFTEARYTRHLSQADLHSAFQDHPTAPEHFSSGAMLAFLIFAWEKAMGLSGEERPEIGISKGVGWDISDILMMKFWEGTVISLTAFLLGVIGAYLHVFFAFAILFEHALKGWVVLYPAFTLQPTVNAFQLAVLLTSRWGSVHSYPFSPSGKFQQWTPALSCGSHEHKG